jgi:hypothetical protein
MALFRGSGGSGISEVGPIISLTLPLETERANKYLAFDSDGEPIAVVSTQGDNLEKTLVVGNTTSGTDLAVSAGDDITFTDTSKAIFGNSSDLQIYHDGSEQSYCRKWNW